MRARSRLPGTARSTMGALRGPAPTARSSGLKKAIKRGDNQVGGIKRYRTRLKWGRGGMIGTRILGWGELGAQHKAIGAHYKARRARFRRRAAETASSRALTVRQLNRAERTAAKQARKEAKYRAKARTFGERANRNAARRQLWGERERFLKTQRQKDIDRLARKVWDRDKRKLTGVVATATDPAKRSEAQALLRAMADVEKLPDMIRNARRTEARLRALANDPATPAADKATALADATRVARDIINMKRSLPIARRRAAGRYDTGVLTRLEEASLI